MNKRLLPYYKPEMGKGQIISVRYCTKCKAIKKFRYMYKKGHSLCLTCKGFACISLLHAVRLKLITKKEYEKHKDRSGKEEFITINK